MLVSSSFLVESIWLVHCLFDSLWLVQCFVWQLLIGAMFCLTIFDWFSVLLDNFWLIQYFVWQLLIGPVFCLTCFDWFTIFYCQISLVLLYGLTASYFWLSAFNCIIVWLTAFDLCFWNVVFLFVWYTIMLIKVDFYCIFYFIYCRF